MIGHQNSKYKLLVISLQSAQIYCVWLGFHKDRPTFGQPDRTETVGPPKWACDGLGPDSVRSTDIFGPGPNEKKNPSLNVEMRQRQRARRERESERTCT